MGVGVLGACKYVCVCVFIQLVFVTHHVIKQQPIERHVYETKMRNKIYREEREMEGRWGEKEEG